MNNNMNGTSIEQGSILCVGNALLDVSFFADKSFLEAHGLKANDAILLEEEKYKTMHAELVRRFKAEEFVPGGAAQNTARATQWALSEFPGTVSYFGALTDDEMGEILKKQVKKRGVHGVYQRVTDGTPTGCCLAVLVGQDRLLAAFLGAALKFTVEHVKDNWKHVERSKFIYIEGFFLSTCLDACMLLAKHCNEVNDKKFLLNLSAEFVTKFHKHMLLEVMPYVDILFGNDSEFVSFGKEMDFGDDLKEIVRKVAALPREGGRNRVVVCTVGDKPVIISVGGEDNLMEIPVLSIGEDKVVDTNGAGDAFVGAFMSQLIRGRSLEDATRAGSSLAAIVIQRLGCTFPDEKSNLLAYSA